MPDRAEVALREVAAAAKEGLLALSVGVGLAVVGELMEEEVDQVVGPRGRHNAGRSAYRHGREAGQVTLGGRRLTGPPPPGAARGRRWRVELETYRHVADRDLLGRVVVERMLAGASCRRYLEGAGAGGQRDRSAGALDLEVGDLARVRGARPDGASGAALPPP